MVIRVHPLQRVIDGPDEVCRPAHWTVPVSMGVYRLPAQPRQRTRDDSSGDFAINLPTRGVYLRGRGARARVVDASQAALFGRGRVYRVHNPAEQLRTGVYLRVGPELAQRLSAGLDEDPWSDQTPLSPATRRSWYALWRSVQAGLSDDALYEGVLSVAARVLSDVQPGWRPTLAPQARARVRAVQLRLAEEFGRRVSLDALAAGVGCSRFALCRAFNSLTGHTVHQHRELLRMSSAAEWLRDPQLDLSELALELGYTSHSHFTARFRRHYGLTPSAWRAQSARI